jgi:small subunit ribosomal protein S6
MQQYELTLIFKSDLTEEQADTVIDGFKLTVIHRQVWGKRLLSYPINKHKEGLYIFLVISLSPEKVEALDKSLKLREEIIRYLLVKAEKDILQ